MEFKNITLTESKDSLNRQIKFLTRELIKRFSLLEQGKSEFREIFGATLWTNFRKTPETLLKQIEFVEGWEKSELEKLKKGEEE